jgi:DNA-binding NtrC family response regulator
VAPPVRSALVVSGHAETASIVARVLLDGGVETTLVGSVRAAADVLAAADGPPALIVVDTELPDGTVLDVMAARLGPAAPAPIVVLTAPDAMELAVEAMKWGAEGFLNKPVAVEVLRKVFERALEPRRRASAVVGGHVIEATPFVGPSPATRELAEQAAIAARTDAHVLISGETGTGKGVLARWVHDESARARGPFVDLNCSSLSKDLFESELYGFEKGAFTSAANAKVGLVEAANRGTMFLDEIGDLDPSVQPRLLKVVEERRFRRLGSVRDQFSDVRFIAASNMDLPRLVREGRFRQDLLFRINTLTLSCVPLRNRAEDIPALATRLAAAVAVDLGRPALAISPDAMEALTAYAWPGNIRELHHAIQRASIVSAGGVIRAGDLRLGAGTQEMPALSLVGGDLTLEALQLRHIQAVLEAEGWNVDKAAQRLGISRSTLYQKIKQHQLGSGRHPR